MASLVFTGPGKVEVQSAPVPLDRPGHCVIRIAYVGLCGVDASFYSGSSLYLHQGLKSYPFVFGHEWSGTVMTVGPGVEVWRPGDRVVGHNFVTCGACRFCREGKRNLCANHSEVGVLGPYPGAASEYFSVPASVLVPVPNGVELREATAVEPSTTVLHAVTRTAVTAEDDVAIIGTGTLGLVAVQLARARGARVTAVGIVNGGLKLARELGADDAISPDHAPHDRYSVVLELSGAAASASLMVRLLSAGGRGAFVGVAHTPVNNFPAPLAVLKNVVLYGVLSGLDYWDRTLYDLSSGRLSLAPLIGAEFPYDRANEAFTALLDTARTRPKILIRFPGADISSPSARPAVS